MNIFYKVNEVCEAQGVKLLIRMFLKGETCGNNKQD